MAGWFASLTRRFTAEQPVTSVPAGRAVYAIGDVHGRADLLETLLGLIDRDARAHMDDR